MLVSAEGRVEHQKLSLLSFGYVFGVQLGLLGKSIPANAGKSADLVPSFDYVVYGQPLMSRHDTLRQVTLNLSGYAVIGPP